MTVKKLAIVFLIFLFSISIGLLSFASQIKYAFYNDLINQNEKSIGECNKNKPIKLTIDNVNGKSINELIKDSIYARIFILSEDDRIQEIQYYFERKLISIDIIGDDGNTVRRDIFDTKGRKRVSEFFLNGKINYKYFFNEKGENILQEPGSIFIPPASGRTGY